LVYIPKSIRRPSLLTWPRQHSYSKAIGLRNWVRDRSGTLNGASKTTCKIDDKNQLKKEFISAQAFHQTPGGRVWEITAGNPFEPQILKIFNPVAQELNWASAANIHTQHKLLTRPQN
jgi:hypothetical protein